jgi:small subunit ribosomal protein S18
MAKEKIQRKPQKRVQPVNLECYFTKTSTKPNYKDVLILRRFISDRGKILPQSRSGVSAKNQRMLSAAIKNARYMGLLPYTDRHSL